MYYTSIIFQFVKSICKYFTKFKDLLNWKAAMEFIAEIGE